MWAVACSTARISFALQMGVHLLELGQHLRVTGEAAPICAGTFVTSRAVACGKGLMLQRAQQGFLCTGMGMMTLQTVHPLRLAPAVTLLPSRIGFMTPEAQFRILASQQALMLTAVDGMATGTLPFFKGGVPFSLSDAQAGMTCGAHLFLLILEQPFESTGMGSMTTGAFPLMYRAVGVGALCPGFCYLGMAAVAQLRLRLLQQASVAGGVQTMARVAAVTRHRFMLIGPFEVDAVMTLDTVKRQTHAGRKEHKCNYCEEDLPPAASVISIHHLFFSAWQDAHLPSANGVC